MPALVLRNEIIDLGKISARVLQLCAKTLRLMHYVFIGHCRLAHFVFVGAPPRVLRILERLPVLRSDVEEVLLSCMMSSCFCAVANEYFW